MQPNTPEPPNERMRLMKERIGKSAEAIKQDAPVVEQSIPTPIVPVAPPPVQQPAPVVEQSVQEQAPEPPLLYKSQESAEYLMRPFDRRRDKSAISSNPYTAGAVDALVILTRKKRYELYDEMVDWLISHYADVLEARPDVVRQCEQVYRDKHRI